MNINKMNFDAIIVICQGPQYMHVKHKISLLYTWLITYITLLLNQPSHTMDIEN